MASRGFLSFLVLLALSRAACQQNTPCNDGSEPVTCVMNPCDEPRPEGCPDFAVCVADYCGGCNSRYYEPGSQVQICRPQCSADECGPQPGLPTMQCGDGTIGGPTGECLRSVDGECFWEIRQCPCEYPACDLACEHGFRLGDDGCAICDCLESPTCTADMCGPQPEIATRQCGDGTIGGLTGECLASADGDCYWEIRQCPCEYPACDLACELGFRLGEDGCAICECREVPTCPENQQCPAISCAHYEDAFIPEGECCPICRPKCSNVQCPQILCAEGFYAIQPPDACCPICVPEVPCSDVMCPDIDICPEDTNKVRRECCDICEPKVDCSDVQCPAVECDLTTSKKVVEEGSCCPICLPREDCATSDLACAACPSGTEAIQTDLMCCPVCRPPNFCENVLCAQPDCPKDLWIHRPGQCCPQCPLCRDEDVSANAETANQWCDERDDPVCPPAYYNGDECSNPVPPSDRVESIFYVQLCNQDNCEEFDTSMIRVLLATLSNLDAKYIKVEKSPRADDTQCCWTYKITIADAINGQIVPDEERAKMEQAIGQSSSGLMVVQENERSSASLAMCSMSVIAIAAATM